MAARHQRKYQLTTQAVTAAWNRSVSALTGKAESHRLAAQRTAPKDLALPNPS
jgi:hypothetical protein